MEEQVAKYLRQRHVEGIDLLIDTYSNLIYGVIYSIFKNQMKDEDVEECYYDVVFTIWSKIDQYDSRKGVFKNWLISIVRFKAIDYLRKCRRLYRENKQETVGGQDDSAEDIVIGKEDEIAIKKMLHNLEEVDEQIFTWRYLEDLSIEEISVKLQMTPQAIYTRISRGKGKLRNWMGGRYDEKS
ncbi:sigma-70 family RNA polymerase sigma factor [Cellulosilyticum sp. I15G10I2]|uniref:sigma-70 family RNA polymerase sigma factor n=1 Tax=Cellulosilyticum sp. I15G10I2 TaxID=1892843 RepID=UPI00085C0898|nr:sigma-70 family RNA polymerase sigma factor [Cellulosilyticum sp. I15G10I2]